jgi:hypothetical protein
MHTPSNAQSLQRSSLFLHVYPVGLVILIVIVSYNLKETIPDTENQLPLILAKGPWQFLRRESFASFEKNSCEIE